MDFETSSYCYENPSHPAMMNCYENTTASFRFHSSIFPFIITYDIIYKLEKAEKVLKIIFQPVFGFSGKDFTINHRNRRIIKKCLNFWYNHSNSFILNCSFFIFKVQGIVVFFHLVSDNVLNLEITAPISSNFYRITYLNSSHFVLYRWNKV